MKIKNVKKMAMLNRKRKKEIIIEWSQEIARISKTEKWSKNFTSPTKRELRKKMNRKRKKKYIVSRTENRDGEVVDYVSYDVSLEDNSGFEFIAEFVYRKDACNFAKMKNKEEL